MDFQCTYQFFWVDAVICAITFIVQTLLFTLHTLVSLQNFKVISFCNCFPTDSTKISKPATLCTFLALLFYFVYGIDVFLSRIDALFGEYFHQHLSFTCDTFVRIGSISYQLSKGCIYCVFVLRLKLAFDGSHFQYSARLLNGLLTFIIIYSIINAINGYLFVTGDKIYIEMAGQNSESFYTCQTNIHIYVIAYMVLVDAIFTALCMFMFIKPLRQIIKYNQEDQRNTMNKENSSTLPQGTTSIQMNPSKQARVMLAAKTKVTKEFKTVIIKYTIVSCVALLSTFCGLIVIGVTDAPAFSMIDVWINASCLLLMCPQYNKYYKILCCGLINCVRSKKVVISTMRSISHHAQRSSVVNVDNAKDMGSGEDEKNTGNVVGAVGKPDTIETVKSLTLTEQQSVSLIDEFNQNSIEHGFEMGMEMQ